jgi:alpha-L-rhamnosidase
VSNLLKQGTNTMVVSLGDGWYRGAYGNNLTRNIFGSDSALLCQLDINGIPVLISDESWEATQDGPLGENDLMSGEIYDARKDLHKAVWHPVKIEDFGYDNLIEQDSMNVTRHETFKAVLLATPDGGLVLDFGQNMAGFVEFDIDAHEGDTIIMQYGEMLDAQGNFTIENFQNNVVPNGHTQKIVYTCKEGKNKYHPTKTFFGFRYVKIETNLSINGNEFTAVAVYSDMKQTAFFECGNADVNKLFQNTIWSMKSNFLDVPTDCPTREKQGWAGDAQIFVDTALYLMDCVPVYRKWLREYAAAQIEEPEHMKGCLKFYAPDGRRLEQMAPFSGSAGWADAMEIIPYKMWKWNNDDSVLKENYDAMKTGMLFNLRRQKSTREENEYLPKELQPWFCDQGMHFGEWCEPGCSPTMYRQEIAQHGEPELVTAYTSYGCRLIAEMAEHLGYTEDTQFFTHAAEMTRKAYRFVFVKNGKITQSETRWGQRQCRYVRPVALGMLDKDEIRPVVKTLADIIAENGYKLNTGFLTTASLCRVLSDNGETETAYRLLLQTENPGWLYAVRHGATTIWENWSGADAEGLGSLNHYSYGAVCSWLMDSVCGIRLEQGHIVISPHPSPLLGYAKAEYHAPVGIIKSEWKYTERNTVEYTIEIPDGKTADVYFPNGKHMKTEGRAEFVIPLPY